MGKKQKGQSAALGRNERCPVCGKKRKMCRGLHRWRLPFLSFVVLVLLTVVVWGIWSIVRERGQGDSAQVSSQALSRKQELTSVVEAYLQDKPIDKWWLTTVPQVSSGEQMVGIANQSAVLKKRLERLLRKWQSVSPLAGEIAKTFPNLKVSVFTNGISVGVSLGDSHVSREAASSQLNSLEVCFIPQDQFLRYRHLAHFYYRQEWGALMMAAIEYPEPVLAGLAFHELGHAYRHTQGAPSANSEQYSDLWITEEVEMHELESQIFNAVSGGAFFARLDAILARAGRPNSAREAVARLRLGDLRYFDAMLDASDCGPILRGILSTQYGLSLGFRHIDQSVPPDKRLGEKIELYRWRATPF